ncbi:MAG: ABC transporter permease [Bacteroidales bacterium]|nr:ABC transporter permease [Bacteroidales bacterium]MBN2699600.1 ABC transporter permease [Bacteroidales bacterium]
MILFRLIWESLIMAVKAVSVNRLRAILSLLGITIGIFAIISVFTIVDSLELNIRESVNSLGNTVVYIEKWPWTPDEGETEYPWWKYLNRPQVTYEEYEFIKKNSKFADGVCFVAATGRDISYKNNRLEGSSIFGISEGFQAIRSFEIESGRYFSPFEMDGGRNYAVIGHSINKELFKGVNPLGKTMEMMGRKLTVVGVIRKEGKGTFGNFNLDDMVLIPLNYFRNIIDITRQNANPMIWVQARSGITTDVLSDELRVMMRGLRRQKPAEEDSFALNQTSLITNQLDQLFAVLKVAGFFIGIFSIIVGGFGIANIMFVSVKERTRIIGIQKATGAKNYFILLQFLFESVMLSLGGGILGLLLVFIGGTVINLTSDFSIYLTLNNILFGIGISSVIGIISGFAPAWQGAHMNPVEAINTAF